MMQSPSFSKQSCFSSKHRVWRRYCAHAHRTLQRHLQQVVLVLPGRSWRSWARRGLGPSSRCSSSAAVRKCTPAGTPACCHPSTPRHQLDDVRGDGGSSCMRKQLEAEASSLSPVGLSCGPRRCRSPFETPTAGSKSAFFHRLIKYFSHNQQQYSLE